MHKQFPLLAWYAPTSERQARFRRNPHDFTDVTNIRRDGQGTANFAAALAWAKESPNIGRQSDGTFKAAAAEISLGDACVMPSAGSVHSASFRREQVIALTQRILAEPPDQRAVGKRCLYAVSNGLRDGNARAVLFADSPHSPPLMHPKCVGNQPRDVKGQQRLPPVKGLATKGAGRREALPASQPAILKGTARSLAVTGKAKVVGVQFDQGPIWLDVEQVQASVKPVSICVLQVLMQET